MGLDKTCELTRANWCDGRRGVGEFRQHEGSLRGGVQWVVNL